MPVKKIIRKQSKKKVLVTGASGMLGTTLYQVFKQAGFLVISTDLTPLDPWTIKLDIRDKKSVRKLIKETSPDFVFNLAALTDLEYCETHQDEAYETNGNSVKHVAQACKELNITMVHISTAGVFDGTKNSPYTEDDSPNPVNIYGKSKYKAEKLLPEILDNYFIFRAGWMMGSGERDKKFVKKVLNLIETGQKTLYGLTDALGNPTYALDFSKAILRMIASRDFGLYNMAGEGYCSRYDVAKKMVEVLGLKKVKVKPVKSDFFKKHFFASRPAFEVVESKKLHDRGLKLMRQWDEALEDYLKTYFVENYGKKKRKGSL